MEKDISLYKVHTKGCGDFFVVAESFDKASEVVTDTLDDLNYGYSDGRRVTSIDLVRTHHTYNGKPFLSGGDINLFLIQNGLLRQDIEPLERRLF